MPDRDEHDPKHEKMPPSERRRILLLLSATVAAPVVSVLFNGSADQWSATA